MRFVAKKSQLCIGASKFLVNFLSLYNKKVVYLPTGVDTEIFKPNKNLNDKKYVVLSWLGTMHREDNVENIAFLIDCFCELSKGCSNIRLEILGDGVYVRQVEELIRKSQNKHIYLKPWIDSNSIPNYLENIDIGVMPLIQQTRFNMAKSPTRVFEYMAMERPVVASCTGEANFIIKNGNNGFLAKDKKEFVGNLKLLINDNALREKIGKNARNTIMENYSYDILSEKLTDIIKQI